MIGARAMSEAKDQHEPSMEEILASIRRIIAEDGDPPPSSGAQPPSAVVHDPDGVLELTEVVNEDGSIVSPSPAFPEPSAPQRPADPFSGPSLAPLAAASMPPRLDGNDHSDDATGAASTPLLSQATVVASAAAFSQLAVLGQRERSPETPLGATNRTLEDIVRELLRDMLHPMLKSWLDENLTSVVERLVKEEIDRMVREVTRR